MNDAPHPGTWPCRLYAARVAGTAPALAASALSIAKQLPAWLGTEPYCWDIESEPSRKISLDDATIERLLGRLRSGRPFLLGDRADDWTAAFAIGVDHVHRREYASLSMPSAAEAQLLELEPMMALVTAFARAFSAPAGYLEDAGLIHAFSGRRAHERNHANLPPEIRDLVPREEFRDLPGLAGPLPQLLVRDELPIDRIPAGLFWINWWSAPLIEELGRSRVADAGWARIEEHSDRSMTLAVTQHPPDLTRREDIDILASIVVRLDLVAAQKRLA